MSGMRYLLAVLRIEIPVYWHAWRQDVHLKAANRHYAELTAYRFALTRLTAAHLAAQRPTPAPTEES